MTTIFRVLSGAKSKHPRNRNIVCILSLVLKNPQADVRIELDISTSHGGLNLPCDILLVG